MKNELWIDACKQFCVRKGYILLNIFGDCFDYLTLDGKQFRMYSGELAYEMFG